MGHCEPTSALASLAKVFSSLRRSCVLIHEYFQIIIAIESGTIPANLHYRLPNPSIPGLINGRLKVVSEARPCQNNTYLSVSSFGFGGANAHMILKYIIRTEI